ncbi:MAG: Wzz/FepE/Etk N-terminal domain-containing protein [Eubacteriales bacterium]|nr:Wzz/FepE/Etk N-terminal domain-containing protein [Eubacteriales bacterium]
MNTQNNQQSDEIEIDLVEMLGLLVRKIPLMITVGLMAALLAFLVSKFLMTPTYQSTTKVYILNKQDSSNVAYSDLQMGTQLTKDYVELIQSRFVLEEVIERLGLDIGYEELKSKVSVTTPTDTRIISVTVEDSDPVMAMKIANAIREAAAVHITNVMDIEAVNVAETADMPTVKSSPSVGRMTLLGGILGVLIVAIVAVIGYFTDDTIKTAEDVEKYLNLSTLVQIPLNEDEKKGKKKVKKK